MAILETVFGSVISASLQVFLDRITSPEFMEFIRQHESINAKIRALTIVLFSVNTVLNDAERKQLGDPDIRVWLDELQEAICDAEDLVDEINNQAFGCNLEGESGSKASKVWESISISLSKFFKATESKILSVLDRVEFLVKQKDLLGLEEGVQARSSPTVPLEKISDVYGRDDDKEAIIDFLFVGEDINMPVISVLGMGGLGKSTLTQMVYNDDRVENKFPLRAWVHVSHEFDVFGLTKKVFEAVTNRTCHFNDLFPLQLQLRVELEGKKFLFVFDDVWNENYLEWEKLTSPFRSGEEGSKIIVTTRSEKVALVIGSVLTHQLKPISDEASWSLFSKHAFQNVNESTRTVMEYLGRKIVGKCKGHPLAIKSLAGILRCEVNIKGWEDILDSNIWELSTKDQNILPALWLSYYHLPQHLKRCFAYCSIFPKHDELYKEQVVLLWMAEGLLRCHEGRRMEDVGDEYFQALVSRSLFQRSNPNGGSPAVTMHDLVHDLATIVSGGLFQRLDDGGSMILASKTRHLTFTNKKISEDEGIEKFEKAIKLKSNHLRTFLALGKTNQASPRTNAEFPEITAEQRLRVVSLYSYTISKLPRSISNLKLLRYLDLSHSKVTEIPYTIGDLYNLQTLLLKCCSNLIHLPESIGHLKHLRYLDLSCSGIKEIPDTICDLYNLQTLLLSDCRNLIQIPRNLGKVTSLRRLEIYSTNLEEMPPHLGEMKALQTLTNFVLGEDKHSGSRIEELGELYRLQGSLEISGLENVDSSEDVSKARLKDKKHLSKLLLKWSPQANVLQEDPREVEVLGKLEPHTVLKELSITSYGGGEFPSWVGDHSFSNIVLVSLTDCRYCSSLPPLGQLPSLRQLGIKGFPRVKTIGAEFYGAGNDPFQGLLTLCFDDMPECQDWEIVGGDMAFPRLVKLEVTDSESLREFIKQLPGRLPSLLN